MEHEDEKKRCKCKMNFKSSILSVNSILNTSQLNLRNTLTKRRQLKIILLTGVARQTERSPDLF